MSSEHLGAEESGPRLGAPETSEPSEHGATPTVVQADPEPPVPQRPAESRHPWRIGAVVCTAAAAFAFALFFALTGQPSRVTPPSARAASSGASSSATIVASGPTFSHLPEQCDLIDSATVAKYLPGAACDRKAYQVSGDRSAMWTSPTSLTADVFYMTHIDVLLSPPSVIQTVYNKMKSETATLMSWATVKDRRPVAGIGIEAYIVFGTSSASSESYLLIVDGNAEIDIQYEVSPIGGQAQAASQSQSETAVLAMARDIIRNLS